MENQTPFLFEELTDLQTEVIPRTRQRSTKKESRKEGLNLFLFPEMDEETGSEAILRAAIEKLTVSFKPEDIVVAMTDPVVIYGLWGDAVPKWLKTQIRIDRLRLLEAKTGEIGTDSEALAYVCTASLSFPLNHDWTIIYQYLLTKIFSSLGKEVPIDLKVEEISRFQESHLSDLKRWIYRVRRKSGKERRRKGGKIEKVINDISKKSPL